MFFGDKAEVAAKRFRAGQIISVEGMLSGSERESAKGNLFISMSVIGTKLGLIVPDVAEAVDEQEAVKETVKQVKEAAKKPTKETKEETKETPEVKEEDYEMPAGLDPKDIPF